MYPHDPLEEWVPSAGGSTRVTPAPALVIGVIAAIVAVGAVPPSPGPLAAPVPGDAWGRTDVRADGNRLVAGTGPADGFTAAHVALSGRPAWVVPDPPLARRSPGGELVVTDARDGQRWFEDALPDGRVVWDGQGTAAALVGPTTRYPHGVLGDAVEAAAVELRRDDALPRRLRVSRMEVIEGTAPILVDLDSDGATEIVVTVSDERDGARLVVLAQDGSVVAQSAPIGQGFRWRHQVGVGPLGDDAALELVSVRTPHIGGVVEAFRLRGHPSTGCLRRRCGPDGRR